MKPIIGLTSKALSILVAFQFALIYFKNQIISTTAIVLFVFTGVFITYSFLSLLSIVHPFWDFYKKKETTIKSALY